VWAYIHDRASSPLLDTAADVLAFVVPLLFLLGLLGLRAGCEVSVGWLGGTGFILGFVGAGWGVVLSVVDLSYWYGYFVGKG
jgi:hypothetical protein